MTAHALRVPTGKQCRCRHDGLVLAVTVDARRHGIRSRRVLMRVTGRAHAVARLVELRMRGADVLVAIVACRSDRLLILMRRVAMQARGRGVDRYGGELPLGLLMTTRAIARAVRLEHCDAGRRVAGVVGGERMTAHAVRARTGAQALLRGAGGVFDARLGCMAKRAATGRDLSHRAFVEFVTLVARDVLLHDVQRVAGHAAVRAPLLLNVHASARRSCRALVRARR